MRLRERRARQHAQLAKDVRRGDATLAFERAVDHDRHAHPPQHERDERREVRLSARAFSGADDDRARARRWRLKLVHSRRERRISAEQFTRRLALHP